MSRPTPETVSNALALALTTGASILLFVPQHLPDRAQVTTPAIQVALDTEPAPPDPPQPTAEPPKPRRSLIHHEVRLPVSAPLMTATVSQPADFSPPRDSDANLVMEIPAPAKLPAGTLDAQYAATLRSNIDSRTAPPNSVEYRLLKPRGEVLVSFTLDRSGLMLTSELARSSGSRLLDHHALEIVRTGRYPPFPGEAFQGESRHSFLITLEFHS